MRVHPAKPQNVKATNISSTGAKIQWDSVKDAKSYVIRYGVDGQPNDRLHYSETNSFDINDTVFAGTLAGLKLHFFVQSFNKTYTGKDEIEKANNAMKDNQDVWSDDLPVDFPTQTKKK